MRRILAVLMLSSFAIAQAPQSPRQALLELIKPSSPAMIDKHTPDVLLQAMAKLPPEQRQKQQQTMVFISLMASMAGNSFQTFETGPVLALIQNPKDNTKVEVTVERDDLAGDTDAMEFGIHVTKDGKLQPMPMDPRILVQMKNEKGVWKLASIGASASIRLDDPKVAELIVKGIQERLAQNAAAANSNSKNGTAPITIVGDNAGTNAIASLRSLSKAEATYATTYPQAGYTCRLSDLGGSLNGKGPDERGAQLINPALEAGVRYGYRFTLSACTANGYKIAATPTATGLGRRTYCTDQGAVVRSVPENGADCWTNGRPVN